MVLATSLGDALGPLHMKRLTRVNPLCQREKRGFVVTILKCADALLDIQGLAPYRSAQL